MPSSFKDLFSGHAADYQQYRPAYPAELFEYLASVVMTNNLAWDCATGNGQAAKQLSPFFTRVIATDASAQQIENALITENIIYRIETAEQTSLENTSVDLITVAQAMHWFDLQNFYTEVQRVLKPGGILAAWSYNLTTVNTEIDELIHHLYFDILSDYWAFDRQHVENGYKDINFPMKKITAPEFEMQCSWNLSQLLGYLSTWSALKTYQVKNAVNPLEKMADDFVLAWGDATICRPVKWPLTLKLWNKD